MQRGLDLDEVDVTTPEEIAAFRSHLLEGRGGKFMHPLSGYSVLIEHRPDMLKRQLRYLDTAFVIPDEGNFRVLAGAAMLHLYICQRYEEGIIHEVRALQTQGMTREQINELVAIAFMHCGPAGLRFLYHAAFDYLSSYEDPPEPARFPPAWAPDPDALISGIDFSSRELSAADEQALFAWYEATVGEVPRSVRVLARHAPDVLKGWRAKLEATLRGALPKQVLPYVLIHFNVHRGFADGLREAVLLARAWNMTQAQVSHAIGLAVTFGAGVDAAYVVDDAVGDLLQEPWPTAG
jgi:hypothetical protein